MKPILAVAVLLALLTATVNASDVRVLNIGDSCADVEAKEAALGSKPIPWGRISGASAHAFKVRDFDGDVELMYLCYDDKLFTGNYVWRFELLDNAANSFRSVHDQLVRAYGTPFLDTPPWHVRDRAQPAIITSEPSAYATDWRTSRIHAHLMIVRNRGDIGWHVTLVIGPAPEGAGRPH